LDWHTSITSFMLNAAAVLKSSPNFNSVASSSSLVWFVHARPDIVSMRSARVARLSVLAHAKRARPAAAIVARVEECAPAKGFAPQDQLATT
jgi:hypothetical protein